MKTRMMEAFTVKNSKKLAKVRGNIAKANSVKIAAPLLLCLLTILALASSAVAGASENLLTDHLFKQRAAVQTVQDFSFDGPSSATAWETWINATTNVADSGIELETDLLLGLSPTPAIPAVHVIHVRITVVDPSLASPIEASGANDGLGQAFLQPGTGPTSVLESVWVYVVSGQVGIGVGNGGDTSVSVTSSTTGHWEHLVSTNLNSPANNFIIYSTDPNGSEFYADDAIVCSADTQEEFEGCQALIAGN
jgi:hypothetical protein